MSVVYDRAYLVLNGIITFFQKFQHVYELWPAEIFAGPGQILGRLQFKTMNLYASKNSSYGLFDMISSSKQVLYTLWTRLLQIQKSKIFYFDQVIVQN